MSTLPSKAKVVIIGGGIHGLSTAWKLSETYKNPGDIIVLEKMILLLVQVVLLVVLLGTITFTQL